jgi:shikimate dehydrogenase
MIVRVQREGKARMDEVNYVSGETRIFAIVGHPIEQVRSPEMITAEMVRRRHKAILIPLDIMPEDFETSLAPLMRLQNLDGLVFTIPFKQRACALASELGAQAKTVGAINALARGRDDRWFGDIFDGLGCVEAFRRRGVSFKDQRVMQIGAGGAGRAIAVAVAHQGPRALRIFDIERERAMNLAADVSKIDASIEAVYGEPIVEGVDILINASPVGMLTDPRISIDAARIPPEVVVFDAIVKPEQTKLLTLAQGCGCRTIFGREMMHGQISKVVDYFEAHNREARSAA